jgi:ATP-binding cassette subfamily A (ABC1) protein 3
MLDRESLLVDSSETAHQKDPYRVECIRVHNF